MTIITVILLICFLATLFMLFSIRSRLTRKIDELSSRHLEAIQMLDHQQQENTKVKKQFADNYKNQFHLLNELCAAYWSPIKKDKKDYIYEQVTEMLQIIDTDVEFENEINSSVDNIMVKLREDMPNHNETDYRFIQYIIAGFDAKTIASIMGYSVDSIYTKKNRIKREISKIQSPHKSLYETFIS